MISVQVNHDFCSREPIVSTPFHNFMGEGGATYSCISNVMHEDIVISLEIDCFHSQ